MKETLEQYLARGGRIERVRMGYGRDDYAPAPERAEQKRRPEESLREPVITRPDNLFGAWAETGSRARPAPRGQS